MSERTGDIEKIFGLIPEQIVNRYRAHWIIVTPDEDEEEIGIKPGYLAIRARDGASNPISVEAVKRANFVGAYEDNFDRTYRYYYYSPLGPAMITREELIERAAKAMYYAGHRNTSWEESYRLGEIYRKRAKNAVRIALEAAAEVALDEVFAEPQDESDYAYNNAVNDVANAIRSLIPENENG